MAASTDFAVDLANATVQSHHGDHTEAFTALVGATILLAGASSDADALYTIAIAALELARVQVASNRAKAEVARQAALS